LEAPSPGSDYSGTVNQDVDVSSYNALMGGGVATSPRILQAVKPAADSEEEYDWAQFLPRVQLTREEHDTLLDVFFKFFSSWCFRTEPEEFLVDMRKYLTASYTGHRRGDSNDPSQDALTSPSVDHYDAQSDVPIKVPKVAHYTPMLHNSILALALAYSDNPHLNKLKIRALFADQAKRYLEAECARPSLACVHALGYLASYYSGQGEQNLGFLFFGMSVRMSQARKFPSTLSLIFLISDTLLVGLGLDCSNWVRSGHISTLDEQDRVWTFWTTYCLDKCWAFYVARDLGVPNPLYTSSTSQPPLLKRDSETGGSSNPQAMSIRLPDVNLKIDEQVWEWRVPLSGRTGGLVGKPSQAMPCNFTSVFQQTCKLMLLATKIMNAT
jgi:Fungal specific transcription factor domain